MHPAPPDAPLLHARLRQALWGIPAAMVAVWVLAGAMVLAALALGAPRLFSPLYYTNLQAAFRALERHGADSWTAMLAARDWLALHPGGNVYAGLAQGGAVKFQYPVTSLLPLALLPQDPATVFRVLNLANLAMLAATIAAMVALTLHLAPAGLGKAARDPVTRRRLAAVALVGSACFYPLLRAAALGQAQVALNLLFVLASLAWVRDRPWTSGALLGLSALVKPQMVLLLVWAVLRREFGMAAAGLGVIVLGIAAACALHGTAWIGGYLSLLSFITEHGEAFFANQSANGLALRWLGVGSNLEWDSAAYAPHHPLVHAVTLAAAIGFTALALSQALRRGGALDRAAAFAVAGIAITIASPIAWEHHYGVLLPGYAVALVATLASPTPWRWRLLVASYLVAGNVISATNWLWNTPLNPLQSYVFFAAVALMALLLRPQPAPAP